MKVVCFSVKTRHKDIESYTLFKEVVATIKEVTDFKTNWTKKFKKYEVKVLSSKFHWPSRNSLLPSLLYFALIAKWDLDYDIFLQTVISGKFNRLSGSIFGVLYN